VKLDREERIKDFECRVSHSRNVYYHRTRGWRYIPVHDFADETDMPVQWVDCWCLLGTDGALLECWRSEQASQKPGLYVRFDLESPRWPKLHAVLTEPLTRDVVERVMERFVELGFPDGEKFLVKADKLVRLE
jgi:hypothetical protein